MFENINIQFNFKDSQASTVAAWGKGETHILRGRIKGSGDLQDDASCDNSEIVPDEKFIEVAGEKVNDPKTKVRETYDGGQQKRHTVAHLHKEIEPATATRKRQASARPVVRIRTSGTFEHVD